MNFLETKNILTGDLKNAIKNHDESIKAVISTISSNLNASQKDKQLKGLEFKDEHIIEVFSKELKQCKESLDGAIKAGREDAINKINSQIQYLEKFLPKQLSGEEIVEELKEIINKLGFDFDQLGSKDMGKIMKEATTIFKGRANGKEVSNILSEMVKK